MTTAERAKRLEALRGHLDNLLSLDPEAGQWLLSELAAAERVIEVARDVDNTSPSTSRIVTAIEAYDWGER